MQFRTTPNDSDFSPFGLVLTIETAEELNRLEALFRYSYWALDGDYESEEIAGHLADQPGFSVEASNKFYNELGGVD